MNRAHPRPVLALAAARRTFAESGRGLAFWVWCGLLLLLPGSGCFSPLLALEPVTIRSKSGQFIVHGLPVPITFSRSSTSAVEYLRLDPAPTAVSLERIRQLVAVELRLPDAYSGTIQVTTHATMQDHLQPRITSVRYTDRWGYRVDLPERIEKDRFLAVAVEVILMEVANRKAVLREAELPPWLALGLAAELQATSLPTLALEPGTEVVQRERVPDPLKQPRELLRDRPALRFDELGQTLVEHLSEEEAAFYRACAHLFVHELLRMRGGSECLRDMLIRLSENLNWQTTFLNAFRSHFDRLIDVDKWYSLNAVNLSGRAQTAAWPLPLTLHQLEDLISVQVLVRLDAGELPIHTRVSLQKLITEWEFEKQHPVLLQILTRLQALRLRASVEALELVDDYVRVLRAYALGRDGKPASALKRSTSQIRAAARLAIKQLDELEVRRRALEPTAQEGAAGR